MANEDKEYNNIFVIPQNYTNSGKLLNGMFETRNLIEAIILLVLIGYPELKFMNISLGPKVIVMIFTLLPVCIFALVGIDGESLVQYLEHIFMYLINKRKLHFKRVGYKYDTEKQNGSKK